MKNFKFSSNQKPNEHVNDDEKRITLDLSINNDEYNQKKGLVFKHLRTKEEKLKHDDHTKQIEKNENEKFAGRHKEIASEVPQWWKMTLNEAADMLFNHVCYLNQERMRCFKKYLK